MRRVKGGLVYRARIPLMEIYSYNKYIVKGEVIGYLCLLHLRLGQLASRGGFHMPYTEQGQSLAWTHWGGGGGWQGFWSPSLHFCLGPKHH